MSRIALISLLVLSLLACSSSKSNNSESSSSADTKFLNAVADGKNVFNTVTMLFAATDVAYFNFDDQIDSGSGKCAISGSRTVDSSTNGTSIVWASCQEETSVSLHGILSKSTDSNTTQLEYTSLALINRSVAGEIDGVLGITEAGSVSASNKVSYRYKNNNLFEVTQLQGDIGAGALSFSLDVENRSNTLIVSNSQENALIVLGGDAECRFSGSLLVSGSAIANLIIEVDASAEMVHFMDDDGQVSTSTCAELDKFPSLTVANDSDDTDDDLTPPAPPQ